MKQTTCVFVLLIGVLTKTALGLDYLTERPDYLEDGCSIKDPNYSQCSIKNLQHVFDKMRDGIPGLKSLPRTDPYHIKKIRLQQNNDAAKFDIELVNLTAVGFGQTEVKENFVDEKDYSWKTKFFIPKLRLEGIYKMNGRLLALTLKGHGPFFIELEKADLKVLTRVKLYEKGGNTFGNVSDCKVDFKIGGLKMRLENLFNGSVELEESLNTLLNENWMDFLDSMRPALSQTMEGILVDNLRKVFHYIPAKYFISDIPTSEQLYG